MNVLTSRWRYASSSITIFQEDPRLSLGRQSSDLTPLDFFMGIRQGSSVEKLKIRHAIQNVTVDMLKNARMRRTTGSTSAVVVILKFDHRHRNNRKKIRFTHRTDDYNFNSIKKRSPF